MNKKQLSNHIGNIDDRLVQQAEQVPNYVVMQRQKRVRKLLATVATLVLMVSSFSVGAVAFAREIVVEVPVNQESVTLEEIGLTLIFPDSWREQYVVIEDTFVPNNATMWEFCVKSVYDAAHPTDESGEVFYRGNLFTVLQYTDYSMSADEFAQDDLAGIGRYLFATEQATYVILYASDVQYDPTDAEQESTYLKMLSELQEIQFAVGDILND